MHDWKLIETYFSMRFNSWSEWNPNFQGTNDGDFNPPFPVKEWSVTLYMSLTCDHVLHNLWIHGKKIADFTK